MYDSTTKTKSDQKAAQGITKLDNLERYRPTEPVKKMGLYESWGLQAISNLLLGKAIVSRLSKVVPHTLVPIIKLSADDPAKVEADYKLVLGYREEGRFFESPQEKYRKIYGNFVRELDWACCELRKYFTKRSYEELIAGSTAIYIVEVLGPFVDMLNKQMLFSKKYNGYLPDFMIKFMTVMTKIFFERIVNITGWLVGPVKLTEFNFREGSMVMEVTDCLLLHAPRMKTFPEEACLLGCKGACEKVLQGPLKMTLDVKLPDTKCEIRSFLVEG
ncbi:MAG: hypothetical protein MUC95_08950 [Spirochaetes bacterium]|nr:hypothetical protein [Spirochaetota bacterium]